MSDGPLSLVIFDIDGTLLDTVEDHVGAYLEALDLFGFSNVDSRWDLYPEHTDSAILHELFQRHRGRRATSDELGAFGRRLAQAFASRTFASRTRSVPLQLIPGAQSLLGAIRNAPSVVCALATGGLREVSIPKVARLASFIEPHALVTASDEESRENILARTVALCLDQTGGTFDRVTYIGDGPWDAIAARDMGVPFIGVGPNIDRFRGECADDDFVGPLGSTRLLEKLGLLGSGTSL